MDEFQDIPIPFGQVSKANNFNQCCIFLVGLIGPTLIKRLYEIRIGGLPYVMEWQNYPEFILGMNEAS